MGPLLFMFPVGAMVGAIVGATRNRTREGAILGFLLAFVGVVVVVCMEPKPAAAGASTSLQGRRVRPAQRDEDQKFVRVEELPRQSFSEAGHQIAAEPVTFRVTGHRAHRAVGRSARACSRRG